MSAAPYRTAKLHPQESPHPTGLQKLPLHIVDDYTVWADSEDLAGWGVGSCTNVLPPDEDAIWQSEMGPKRERGRSPDRPILLHEVAAIEESVRGVLLSRLQ